MWVGRHGRSTAPAEAKTVSPLDWATSRVLDRPPPPSRRATAGTGNQATAPPPPRPPASPEASTTSRSSMTRVANRPSGRLLEREASSGGWAPPASTRTGESDGAVPDGGGGESGPEAA